MMHREDNTRADRVHSEHPDPADSVDESIARLAAAVSGCATLPETFRVMMLALLDASGDIDCRLAEYAGKTLRVRRWDETFEVAQTRKIKGIPKWIALPVKHDGSHYRRLIEGPNGAARFGVWTLLCQVAMKCRVRGILADEDGPLSLEDISLKTGCPLVSLLDALPALLSIGWLEIVVPDDVIKRASTSPKSDEAEAGSTLPDSDDEAGSSGINRSFEPDASGDATAGSTGKPDLIVPAELARLVNVWNSLPPDIAASVKSSELPALCSAWERIERDKTAADARELLCDADAVIEAVRASSFLHRKAWFCLAWLLKREHDGPRWNIEKLTAGQYRDDPASSKEGDTTIEALNDF